MGTRCQFTETDLCDLSSASASSAFGQSPEFAEAVVPLADDTEPTESEALGACVRVREEAAHLCRGVFEITCLVARGGSTDEEGRRVGVISQALGLAAEEAAEMLAQANRL